MKSDMLPTPRALPPPLLLDKRQRAMLKEMGIRVGLPLPDAAQPAATPSAVHGSNGQRTMPRNSAIIAPESIAAKAVNNVAGKLLDQKNRPGQAEPADSAKPAASGAAAAPAASGATWLFAAPHALYADAAPGEGGPRWLVLAETAASALQDSDFHPFDGEAGKLLDNMLRATRLAEPGRAVLVPMCRQLPGDVATSAAVAPGDASAALAALLATHQPHLLLVMGRLAVQALLGSTEPLGKLRGRVHTLHGVKTIVTYDTQPLLRTPADKAKAWDDLCLGRVEARAAFKPD